MLCLNRSHSQKKTVKGFLNLVWLQTFENISMKLKSIKFSVTHFFELAQRTKEELSYDFLVDHLAILQIRGAQFKSNGRPKTNFGQNQGPKLICCTHSKGVFIKQTSLTYQISSGWGANFKLPQAVCCASLLQIRKTQYFFH